MSFLTPLYLAGALAVALPILFHLIRRAPQQRQVFSSLMFLAPTPPRTTRRSRLSNIVLLLLRAAALTLLALAFARPLFRDVAAAAQDRPPGRRIALLVDTSASMRREDLWPQAQKQVEQTLADVTPADEVSLFLFDRTLRPALTFEQWGRLEPSQRVPALRATLAAVQPGWAGTALGDALGSVAEQLAATEDAKGLDNGGRRKVVLVSDLQQGAHADALQGHQWPDAVVLEVRPVAVRETSNASPQLIRPPADAPDAADDRPRVRVSSVAGATAEKFSVAWANENGPLPTTRPTQVYVPAGHQQTVRLDWPPPGQPSDRLVLSGDAAAFDNTLFLTRPRQDTSRVVYVGDDEPDDPKGLLFYLRTALADTPRRHVELTQRRDRPLTAADLSDAGAMVITKALPPEQAAFVRDFARRGGDVLWVMLDPSAAAGVADVAGVASVAVRESATPGFSLVSRVDVQHPLFAAFADARFGDFSRVHFWKHRRVDWPEKDAATVIAAFDNGDPFLFERSVGKGRLILATSGWQPGDSQLALSTKFVPMLDALVRPRGPANVDTALFVGDTVAGTPADGQKRTLTTPDGREIDLSGAAGAADLLDRPGIYTMTAATRPVSLAVNLHPDESRTAPLDPAELKQWGAKFDTAQPPEAAAGQQRQLKRLELESHQKIWQWVLVGVLTLVAAETALAGRLTRRASAPAESPAGGR